MSNLFSCLWFNEVDRFTPRDQLSFAYTYQKLNKKNPGKTFYIHMFKVRNICDEGFISAKYLKYYHIRSINILLLGYLQDCERRQIAKLFHHRSEEKRRIPQDATE